jgi:TonB family protein
MIRALRVMELTALIACSGLARPLPGQSAELHGSWLEWKDLQIAMSPDPSGTMIWINIGPSLSQTRKTESFYGVFNPAATRPWVHDARRFMNSAMSESDTAVVRTSSILSMSNLNRVYVARRKRKGQWTAERFLIFEAPASPPVILNGTDEVIGGILDSLEQVVEHTPPPDALAAVDTVRLYNPLDTTIVPPAGSARNLSPQYPETERSAGRQGMVVLSFIVGLDGKIDLNSVKIVYSRSPEFFMSVRHALPTYRFDPAIVNGTPVPMRVMMPFSFLLRR